MSTAAAIGLEAMASRSRSGDRGDGFTVIELLVVLAAVGLLLSIAAPRYVAHLDRAKEVALRHDLRAMREAIDKFQADQGRYPQALDELVQRRYLRELPVDPVTQRSDSWLPLAASSPERGVADVRSGARGRSTEGSDYAQW